MKTAFQSLMVLVVLTVLTGVIYPLAVSGVGQFFFSNKANGQMIQVGDKVIGSRLIGQKTTSAKYFWPRPSSTDYNAAASSGSNLGPTSADLKKAYDERLKATQAAHPDQAGMPPLDMLFASGSGVDPEISPAAAFYQLNRVAKARNLDQAQTQKLAGIVEELVEKPTLGFMGDSRVNVLDLNLAMDKEFQ
ncbi:MAG: potassium-transporting ATPase subunit KdpC [Proteobacteria bacterium]|nr:MAG: potassium-transporting ATPase subunit KdpC [Pseudomonadota bacterium]